MAENIENQAPAASAPVEHGAQVEHEVPVERGAPEKRSTKPAEKTETAQQRLSSESSLSGPNNSNNVIRNMRDQSRTDSEKMAQQNILGKLTLSDSQAEAKSKPVGNSSSGLDNMTLPHAEPHQFSPSTAKFPKTDGVKDA